MALIKTISELKALLPRATSQLASDSNLPNFLKAEAKYLVPLVGQALYDDIHTKYNAGTLAGKEITLCNFMQLMVASYALNDELVFGHSMITDSGIKTSSTGSMDAAHRWEFIELKNALNDSALDAKEVLLAYLFTNKADFTLFTSSEQYAAFAKLLIKTAVEFSSYITLFQPFRTFWAMATKVSDAQQQYIATSIGNNLLSFLVNYAGTDEDILDIILLLKKALANYGTYKAMMQNVVRFTDMGLTTIYSSGDPDNADSAGRQPADNKLIDMQLNSYAADGKSWLSKALNDLAVYYETATDTDFKTAYEAGPLVNYTKPANRVSGNSTLKGGFRF